MQIANAARRRGSSRGNFRFQSCQNLAFYTRTSLLCSSETKVLHCNFEYSLSGLAVKLRGPLTYGHGRDERGTGRSPHRQANFPRTVGWFVSPSGHRWQTSFCLNGFARRAGERVWGHKSVQLPPSPDGRRTHTEARSFVRSPFPDLFRRAARSVACLRRPPRPRRPFPLYSGREGWERGELCQITTADFGKRGRPDHMTPFFYSAEIRGLL